MHVCLDWKSDLQFTLSEQDQNSLDPVELILFSLAKSSGIAALQWLKQQQVSPEKLQISAQARFATEDVEQLPTNLDLIFRMEASMEHTLAVNAVEEALYVKSNVAAMLSRVVTVGWKLIFNGTDCGEGIANFDYSLNEEANHLNNL